MCFGDCSCSLCIRIFFAAFALAIYIVVICGDTSVATYVTICITSVTVVVFNFASCVAHITICIASIVKLVIFHFAFKSTSLDVTNCIASIVKLVVFNFTFKSTSLNVTSCIAIVIVFVFVTGCTADAYAVDIVVFEHSDFFGFAVVAAFSCALASLLALFGASRSFGFSPIAHVVIESVLSVNCFNVTANAAGAGCITLIGAGRSGYNIVAIAVTGSVDNFNLGFSALCASVGDGTINGTGCTFASLFVLVIAIVFTYEHDGVDHCSLVRYSSG